MKSQGIYQTYHTRVLLIALTDILKTQKRVFFFILISQTPQSVSRNTSYQNHTIKVEDKVISQFQDIKLLSFG